MEDALNVIRIVREPPVRLQQKLRAGICGSAQGLVKFFANQEDGLCVSEFVSERRYRFPLGGDDVADADGCGRLYGF